MPDPSPNVGLIGTPGSRQRLATPALILDLDAFDRNLSQMQGILHRRGLKSRPHAKTHKCSEIARRQLASGAVGICVASLREAEAMARAGIAGLLVTSPVVGDAKTARFVRLCQGKTDIMAVVDHPDNVRALGAAARSAGTRIRILVDVDIGMHRTGVASVADAVTLARLIATTDGLAYSGVQGYSGRVQHIDGYAERDRTYSAQLRTLRDAVAALTEAGLAPAIVSGGGTGTLGIDCADGLMTEQQAGSYIFMDVEYNSVEIFADENARPFETALAMRNTVVSANARGFVTIDGGFKCFATDGPAPMVRFGAPEGSRYEFYGDEHGRIVFGREDQTLPLGSAVELVTPHCDPTVNLHDCYHVVRGDVLVDMWPIDARGVL
jgi:D-serine deaminase-like pyridoxal phosphate-dependent protein